MPKQTPNQFWKPSKEVRRAIASGDRKEKTARQRRYEAHIAQHPTYHDGTARKTWDELPESSRASWDW